jgi:hypothetical protein
MESIIVQLCLFVAEDIEYYSQRLVKLSKEQGSSDNISVIVVFLTEPTQLASRPIPQWANGPPPQEACAMETTSDHTSSNSSAGNNPFLACSTTDSVQYQKGGLLLDLGGGGDNDQIYRHNGTSPSATDQYFLDRPKNGNNTAGVDNYEDDDDDDFGPETDVDAVDDVLLSPAGVKSAALNNNPFGGDEKKALEADLELQRQQLSDYDAVREPREETPTPPADEGKLHSVLLPAPLFSALSIFHFISHPLYNTTMNRYIWGTNGKSVMCQGKLAFYEHEKIFLGPQFYLQTVLLHSANRSESKGRLIEECPVALLCGEWVYGNRVWQQGVDAYRLMLTNYNYK